jgi:hypothetical protein
MKYSDETSCGHSFSASITFVLFFVLFALVGCDNNSKRITTSGAIEAEVDETASEETTPEVESFLQVGAIYNADSIQIRLRFETDTPSWYHQYWVFDGEAWQRLGSGSGGPDPDGLYEDRISIMWDDGSVEGFDVMGGYITVHQGTLSTRSEAASEDVQAHPILGAELGLDEVTKFIPESRLVPETSLIEWQDVRSVEALQELRERGVFIDLWQWRAHRSHPVGFGDNGYVLEARHGAEGRSMFITNRDSATGLPAWMYNPEIAGFASLDIDALRERAYGQEDRYFLLLDEAAPFDPDHDWQAGDAIPHRVLQQPSGSRGAIRSAGDYRDGAWDIRLTRSLESPNPLDSKNLIPGKVYNVAFAVHQASGARHHWVSIPIRLGIGVDADITALEVEEALDAHDIALEAVRLFRPSDPTYPTTDGD